MAEPAARLLDPIAHTKSRTGFLSGLVAGIAVGVAVVAVTVATGGAALAVMAAAGGAVATAGGGAMLGQALGGTYETPTGSIAQLGSQNVLVNSRPAARAMLDAAVCSTHAPGPPKPIAQGAEMVLINGMPAARKTSLIACGAKVSGGSPNVLLGGPTATLMNVSPEVPAWMTTTAQAMVLVGGAVALGAGAAAAFAASGLCGLIAFAGETAGGMIGGALGGSLGGDVGEAIGGERGRIIGEFLGGMLGGYAGGKLGRRTVAGHPVDVASGELFTEELDFEMPGPLPLRWRRTWISSSTRGAANGGPLGEGWHHSFDMALLGMADGNGFAVRLADGRYAVFAPPGPASPSINSVEHLVLETDGEAFWITDYDGVQYQFGAPHPASAVRALKCVKDVNGNAIALERVGGRLVSLTDSAGRTLIVESDLNGRILGVDGPHPDREGEWLRLVSYQYNEAGNLASAADAHGAAFRFCYENHLMVEERRPAGLTFSFVWDDPALGRAARCVDTWGRRPSGEGGEIYRARLVYDVAACATMVTNGEGATWRYRWNARHQVERQVDPLGHVTKCTYDSAGRITSTVSPAGHTVWHAYDHLGRLVVRSDTDGSTAVSYATDIPDKLPLGRTARFIGADGAVQHFGHDECGNLIQQTDAEGRTISYQRDGRGLLLSVHDEEGFVWRCAWSAAGDLTADGTAHGGLCRYEYDRLGRVIALRRGKDRALRITRDAVGNVAQLTWADASTVEVEYNEENRAVVHRDPLGRETRWQYDGLPVQTAQIGADGRTIRYVYDGELRLIEIQNQKLESYTLTYDAAGRFVAERGFDGRFSSYRLDPDGHLLEMLDGKRSTRFVRDGQGRVLEKLFSDGTRHRFSWDVTGRLIRAVSPESDVAFTYDAAGRLREERQGDVVLSHRHDRRGRLVETLLPNGHKIGLIYGSDGLFAKASFGGIDLTNICRDEAGREVRRTTSAVTQYQSFDEQGRLSRQSGFRCDGTVVFDRCYGYDRADQIVVISDVARGKRQLRYDACGYLQNVTGSLHSDFLLDRAGNILGLAEHRDDLRGEAKGNRLDRFGHTTFEYDEFGNRAREAQGTNETEIVYYYGPDDQLREVKKTTSNKQVTAKFCYDALGRRISKKVEEITLVSGLDWEEPRKQYCETGYVWNGDVLLSEAKAGGDPLATVYVYEPETFLPLAQIRRERGSSPIGDIYYYHLDNIGAPQELTCEEGSVVWAVEYEAWGAAARNIADEITQPLRWQGQYCDNEISLHYNRFRYYSPKEGRFLQQDPIRLAGGLNSYSFAPNPFSWIDPLGLACGPAAKRNSKGQWIDKNGKFAKTPPEPNYAYESWVHEGGVPGTTKGYHAHGTPNPINSAGTAVPKSKFNPGEGGGKFSSEVYNHSDVQATQQGNGRWKYAADDLGRPTGKNQVGGTVQGGDVIVEGSPAFNPNIYNPGDVVTQYPR